MNVSLPIKRKYIFAAVVLLLALGVLHLLATPSRADITVSARMDADSFPVNQAARLAVTVNGARSPQLQKPEVKGFEMVQTGQSSQINIINGSFSSSNTTTYSILASSPGKYTIPPITIKADGKTLTTDPIPFEVTPASSSAGSGSTFGPPASNSGIQSAGAKTAFIQVLHAKKRGYLGEVMPITIKVYIRQGLRVNLNSYPTLLGDGCVMAQLRKKPRQTTETVNGAEYNVLSWDTTLSAIKEGTASLQLQLNAILLIPQRRLSTSIFGNGSPFNDPFFDNFFGGYTKRPLTVTSGKIAIDILHLPQQDRPQNFHGAVGHFTLQSAVAPDKAQVGDPLTLTMTIRGSGNFDLVQAPRFPESPEWKTYTPSANFTADSDDGYSGKKVFSQAVVAKSPAVRKIPTLSFSYFDPDKGMYITRETPPIPITITGVAAPSTTTVAQTQAQPALPPSATRKQGAAPPKPTPASPEGLADLAPLHLEPGTPVRRIRPPFEQPWFLVLVGVCLLILTVLAGLQIRRVRIRKNPQELQRQMRGKALRNALKQAEAALLADDPAAFLTCCRSTVQRHFGQLWACGPETITSADLGRRLSDAPALIEILSVAEQAVYGRISLGRNDMENFYRTLQTELEKRP